jgi:hypothetical protein
MITMIPYILLQRTGTELVPRCAGNLLDKSSETIDTPTAIKSRSRYSFVSILLCIQGKYEKATVPAHAPWWGSRKIME